MDVFFIAAEKLGSVTSGVPVNKDEAPSPLGFDLRHRPTFHDCRLQSVVSRGKGSE